MPYRTGSTNVEKLNADKADSGTTAQYVDDIWDRRCRITHYENGKRADSYARRREVIDEHESALERLNRQH